MAELEEGLKTELTSVTGLSGKMFPVLASQGTKAPYLVYEQNDAERTKILSGFDGLIEGSYQLELYHSTYPELKALKKLVIAELKTIEQTSIGATGPYIQQIEITDQSEIFEVSTGLYVCSIAVNFIYDE